MKLSIILFISFLILSFISGIYFCSTYELIYNVEGMEDGGTPQSTGSPTSNEKSCPDLLIKSGNSILMYNSSLHESPGTNPIVFANLDEYINYLEIQKNNGSQCPVLFLQEENNTQGQTVYRVRPDIFNPQGGLPTQQQLNMPTALPPSISSNIQPQNIPMNQYRQPMNQNGAQMVNLPSNTPMQVIDSSDDNPPYNAGQYSGFDPTGLQIGKYTTLDAIHDSTYKGHSLSENPMDGNWGGVLYTKSAVDSGKYKENEVMPPNYNQFALNSDNIHDQKISNQRSLYS